MARICLYNTIEKYVDYCLSHLCFVYEGIGLNITKDYLLKKQKNGLRFQLSGKRGKEVFHVPASYIEGFLSAVNNHNSVQK